MSCRIHLTTIHPIFNNINDLVVLQKQFNLPESQTEFPIIFPMKVHKYRIYTNVFVGKRYICKSRSLAKIDIAFARRMPLSVTAAAVCTCAIGLGILLK